MVVCTYMGMAAQGLNGVLNRIPEANCNLWKIQRDEIITKLPHDVVAGRLPIRNPHERGPLLFSAIRASVCLFTESQNSSSAISFDASPSTSNVSSSSCVPENPGTIRCSTAVKAASKIGRAHV